MTAHAAGPGWIDTHCHLLPGLDDGAQTIAESLEFCRLARADGVAVTFGTPHVREDTWFNRPDAIRTALEEVRSALESEGIEHEVAFGGEVHIHPDLLAMLDDGQIPTMADGGKYLLLEFPRVFPDYLGEELVEALCGRGVVPIIAHPERIDTLVSRPQLLYRMVRSGALGQITGGSLEGTFGREAKAAARLFLRCGLAHFLASDAHSTRRRRPVLTRAFKAAQSLVGEEKARRLVLDNPRAILEGAKIDPGEVSDPAESGGFLRRLFGG